MGADCSRYGGRNVESTGRWQAETDGSARLCEANRPLTALSLSLSIFSLTLYALCFPTCSHFLSSLCACQSLRRRQWTHSTPPDSRRWGERKYARTCRLVVATMTADQRRVGGVMNMKQRVCVGWSRRPNQHTTMGGGDSGGDGHTRGQRVRWPKSGGGGGSSNGPACWAVNNRIASAVASLERPRMAVERRFGSKLYNAHGRLYCRVVAAVGRTPAPRLTQRPAAVAAAANQVAFVVGR